MKTSAVMVGLAIGDALGMPFETLDETVHAGLASWDGSFKPGTFHDLPAGHWTDDTEMATCLATSLIEQMRKRGSIIEAFDGADVAARYLAWSSGTPHGMGGTTRKAMAALARGVNWRESGVTFESANEVGSAPPMRAAPIGVAAAVSPLFNISMVCALDAYITHAHIEAVAASTAVAWSVALALHDHAPSDIIRQVVARIAPEQIGGKTWVLDDLERIQTSLRLHRLALGTDVDGLQHPAGVLTVTMPDFSRRGNARSITATAIYCALAYDNFRDGVMAAVKLGGDADTRGAITGAILGARFGLEGIPEEYKAGVKDFEQLAALDRALATSGAA